MFCDNLVIDGSADTIISALPLIKYEFAVEISSTYSILTFRPLEATRVLNTTSGVEFLPNTVTVFPSKLAKSLISLVEAR